MEPISLITAAALSAAFIRVIDKLSQKVVELGIEPTIEIARAKMLKGYEAAKAAQELRAKVMAALDKTRQELPDAFNRSKITNILTGRSEETYQLLAAATVEMANPDPDAIPARLLSELGLEETHRGLLACFLTHFRPRLLDTGSFAALVTYANDLDRRGLLAGLSADVAGIARDVSGIASDARRTADAVELLVAHFGIGADEDEELRQYLSALSDKLRWLPLPLADPAAAGDKTDAELRRVFVPLSLRDQEAGAQAKRRSHRTPAQAGNQALEAETQPLSLGEIIGKHRCFAIVGKAGCGKSTLLKRAALAFAEGYAAEDLDWGAEPLFPVFVRLRNFGVFLSDHPDYRDPGPGAVTAYLHHHFSKSYNLDLNQHFFTRRLEVGGCLVLFDGLDEVSQDRSDVAQQVDAFIRFYVARGVGNHFGLASRPRGFETVRTCLRYSKFVVCDVNPLGPRDIRLLTAKLLGYIVSDPWQLVRDTQDLPQKILASSALTDLASTPLFCTALTLVYKFLGSDLPQRRVDVLAQVVELLLVFWRAQDPDLVKGRELAVEDGTGVALEDLETAAANKRSRLSHLAYCMQTAEVKTEVDAETARAWLEEYLQTEEGRDPQTAAQWAAGFLRYAHEHSGLFVEDLGPGVFAFTHEGFREYLAAQELADRGEGALVNEILDHLLDDTWEAVILLAAALKDNSRRVRKELIGSAMQQVADLRAAGDHAWVQALTMTAAMACDMDEYLLPPIRKPVEQALQAAALDAQLPPPHRAGAADALDKLGYFPAELYTFCPIPNPQAPQFHLARYPLTNAQYERFLKSGQFGEPRYWLDFPRFTGPEKNYARTGDWGETGWEWYRDPKDISGGLAEKDDAGVIYPRDWHDPRFGIARRSAPVVGISWYEANAYCRWLAEHWGSLPEAQHNPGLAPGVIRLPTALLAAC